MTQNQQEIDQRTRNRMNGTDISPNTQRTIYLNLGTIVEVSLKYTIESQTKKNYSNFFGQVQHCPDF